jgi:MFS transporter, DHA1 family, multidrug resistance protein
MDNVCSSKKQIYLLVFLIPFLLGIGIDLYVPSLPAIVDYFQVNRRLVQLTISSYMLGYGSGQLFLGVFSDSFGRKRILIICSFAYGLFSLLSAYASNIYLLNFYRLLQGLGAAGLGVVIRAVITDCFSGISLRHAMTYLASSWALGPIIGPFIGGYIQQYFGWQANFYVFSVYGIVLGFYILFVIAETNNHLQPFHPLKIYKTIKTVIVNPIFIIGTVILSFIYGVLVVFNIVGPFLIQVILKYSAVTYGYIALSLGIAYFVGIILNKILIKKMTAKKISVYALFISTMIGIIMLLIGLLVPINLYIIVIPVYLLFILCGLVFPNILSMIFSLFPHASGTASAIYGAFGVNGTFLITTLASLLKTTSQIPMVILYIALLFISLVLMLIALKLKKKINNKSI